MFDNEEIGFLKRRFMNSALDKLKEFRDLTYTWAKRNAQEHGWENLWKMNLPSVAYHNQFVQRAAADELIAANPTIEHHAQTAYKVYCRLYLCKDADGKVHQVHIMVPPFYEFYHVFLTFLAGNTAVVEQTIFGDPAKLEVAAEHAMLDALRTVLQSRIVKKQEIDRGTRKRSVHREKESPDRSIVGRRRESPEKSEVSRGRESPDKSIVSRVRETPDVSIVSRVRESTDR